MMRAPSAGELDTLVTVYRRVDNPALDMGLTSDETIVIRRWAKIEPVGTAIYRESAQIDIGITHRIYFDYTDKIRAGDEVKTPTGEIYRVQRSCAFQGKKVCTILEVEEL